MKVRKILYNIDYIHLINFSQFYRSIVAPYFDYENLSYGIDNPNTLEESIRLIFKNECCLLQFRKDGAVFVYEGDIAEVKKSHAVLGIFFEIYEKIRTNYNFLRTTRHKLTIFQVEIKDEGLNNKFLEQPPFMTNPYGKLKELSAIYEWEKDSSNFKVQIGNYSEADIIKFDLRPFKTEYNADLEESFGIMAQAHIQEQVSQASYSKFKGLLEEVVKLVQPLVK